MRSIESLLPVRGKSKVRKIFTSINELLSTYTRSQLNICLLLTVYYVIGLHIIVLDFALLLSIFIPFIGVLISFLLVIISSYFTFGVGIQLEYIVILAVFAADSLFVILRIVFAIPIAGIMKVFLSHIIDYYKSSKTHKS